ncbi:cytosolic protein [Lactobacillus sp. XV13L]|nr:cytosolic protein [Lactobacillus sp. XV13L]
MYDLTNCRIVFTGQLLSFKRRQAINLSKVLGALPQTSLSKNVDFVIVVSKGFENELTTNKLKYAQSYKIPIIAEREFLEWATAKIITLKNNLE